MQHRKVTSYFCLRLADLFPSGLVLYLEKNDNS